MAKKRICAILLAALFAFAAAFSLAFIAHAAGHDCSGEDCPVCAALEVCLNVLRVFAFAVFAAFAALAAVCAARFALSPHAIAAAAQTPTSLKVKLLN